MGKKKELSEELLGLLSLKASEEEKIYLAEMGIHIKNPTHMTVVAASLYKKAAVGELSAIKELISVIGPRVGGVGGVTLVEDIGKP